MMTENDTPDAAAVGPEDPQAAKPDAGNPDATGPGTAGKTHHSKPHDHYASPGAESTRELREMARRRREAEEKLQQHLREAKEKPADGRPGGAEERP